jgi:hypothetical protein
MTALHRIEAAGFTLNLRESRLIVTPADRLTDAQRAFIASNKAELVVALAARVTTGGEATGYVCCASCRHSVLSPNTEPRYGWRSCALDLPNGGGFGQALRRCEQWEAAP